MIHSKDSMRVTDPKLIATAYYYYLLNVMQRFAILSNNRNDIAGFAAEAAKVKATFNRQFYNKTSAQYSNNTVTANILPLAFGMIPSNDSAKVFQNIADKILVENAGHISTGVIGTQWLMRWLTKYGRADIAYQLASNKTYPSWGYMAENGATTIWELWNGNTANPGMNSQNHVMLLGDLLIWMYENLGGIQSDVTATGYKKIIMNPSFVKGLDHVNASYHSPYGIIESKWKKEKEELKWDVTIPANTTATIYIPAATQNEVTEGGKIVTNRDGVRFLRMESGDAIYEVGSGKYKFSVEHKLALTK
jgi:alpha-L-rhamnosidase